MEGKFVMKLLFAILIDLEERLQSVIWEESDSAKLVEFMPQLFVKVFKHYLVIILILYDFK